MQPLLFEIVILEWMLHSKRESTQHASVSQGFTGAQNQIKRRENQKVRARTVPAVSPNTRTVIGLTGSSQCAFLCSESSFPLIQCS